MIHIAPIPTIKRLTVAAAKAPTAIAGAALGLAKSAVRGAQGAADEKQPAIDPDRPVNVTEELGLDAAPVTRPKAPKPLTDIDAQADPDNVDVTPADIADAVKKD